jgi:hypothetical protein
MRVYEIYAGQTLKGHIRVEENAPKVWDFREDEFGGWWLDADDRKAIEQTIDHAPQQKLFVFKGYTIRQQPLAGEGVGESGR